MYCILYTLLCRGKVITTCTTCCQCEGVRAHNYPLARSHAPFCSPCSHVCILVGPCQLLTIPLSSIVPLHYLTTPPPSPSLLHCQLLIPHSCIANYLSLILALPATYPSLLHCQLLIPHSCIANFLSLTFPLPATYHLLLHCQLLIPHFCIANYLSLTLALPTTYPSLLHCQLLIPHSCIASYLSLTLALPTS
jgi:hypothetical protein